MRLPLQRPSHEQPHAQSKEYSGRPRDAEGQYHAYHMMQMTREQKPTGHDQTQKRPVNAYAKYENVAKRTFACPFDEGTHGKPLS